MDLCAYNPRVLGTPRLKNDGDSDVISLLLSNTRGLIETAVGLQVRDEHELCFRFPRFFPALPIEGYVFPPVFHPNVDPETGFACLWARSSPGDTMVEALVRIQKVISWAGYNVQSRHVLQPKALCWLNATERAWDLPLSAIPIALPEGLLPRPANFHQASGRRRIVAEES